MRQQGESRLAKSRNKSSWRRSLQDARIVLIPSEMVGCIELRAMDPAALGLFLRLLPYAAIQGLPDDMRTIAILANAHVRTLRRHWPAISELFIRNDHGWALASLPWLCVQSIGADRQGLRHLLDRLVAFWGNACAYCGTEAGALHIEHIVPVVRGGGDDLTNLTLACAPCNSKKRTKTAAEFGYPHIHELAARIQ